MCYKYATPYVSILILISSLVWAVSRCDAQQTKKPFTVAHEIELASFGDPYTWQAEAVQFSPDGNYFAVDTERGRLDLNRVEDSLRFYRSQDVKSFLEHSDESQRPSPVWVFTLTNMKGPIITNWRWLADSSGVAFLQRMAGGNRRLVLADLRRKTIEPLTSATETVKAFDIRNRNHYVFTVSDPAPLEMRDERQAAVMVGTGRSIFQLLLPEDPKTAEISSRGAKQTLWAVVGSKRFEVKNDGARLVLFGGDLALSPDSGSLVTTLLVAEVPSSWETLYPPPFASDSYRIRAGHGSASQYVRIDLQTGSVQALTNTPTSADADWWVGGGPMWSNDGQAILLPGTFLSSKDHLPSRPCVAVLDLPSNNCACVEMLKGPTETGVEEGFHIIRNVRFVGRDKQRVMVSFLNYRDFSLGTTEYRRTAEGTWQVAGQNKGESDLGRNGLEVTVKQGLDEPPLLVATNKQISRAVWDPNPQLKNIELGQASVYTWKDKEGRDWEGGLYKPSGYKPGQRYPLVIQTHGFYESEFRPSGIYPAAFAARALAAVGIMVLQVGEHCPGLTPNEGPCGVSGYESAVEKLISEALVDPKRIGIIGFSRTAFYVMETLTTGSLHLKAASVTDGTLVDYWQYILWPERFPKEANTMIGAAPFGEGLQQWLKRSPGFNLDKITTPLSVVAEGPISLLLMWEPYAGLRYLNKPVDLIVLNTDEHVLTNPEVRMASQGGTVDWFRFWLKDEEDPDPAKAEQYTRWGQLRKLQEENEHKLTAPRATSN